MLLVCIFRLRAQTVNDSTLQQATLQSCVQYALTHQPAIQQSFIDEEITERQIKTRLADWYPQISFDYTFQHYLKLPVSVFPDFTNPDGPKREVTIGVKNTSTVALALNQNIFNRDVLLASRTANVVRQQVRQLTTNNKIDVTVNVSKAYYDVLLTQKQIELLDEDIVRLDNSLKVAFAQYQGGLVDKIDYKRATISLNNAKAQKKSTAELIKAKFAYLKEQMGYPDSLDINLKYDSVQMIRETTLDTNQTVSYATRIEFQLLQTQQRLQQANLKYYRWSYIPSLSAFANYNLAYQNDAFSDLYSRSFPNSYAGLRLSLPIFQGTKRTQEIRQAELELWRVDYDIVSLKNAINTQYTQALSVYKGNLNDYGVLKDNLDIAQEVYNTIQLQYKSGVKTFLDVIIAEADLRTSQVNYTNALYQVLSSKLDVQRALGTIQY